MRKMAKAMYRIFLKNSIYSTYEAKKKKKKINDRKKKKYTERQRQRQLAKQEVVTASKRKWINVKGPSIKVDQKRKWNN